jgi:hypothetical protein
MAIRDKIKTKGAKFTSVSGLAGLLDVLVGFGDLEDAAALLVRRPGPAKTEISEDGVAHFL